MFTKWNKIAFALVGLQCIDFLYFCSGLAEGIDILTKFFEGDQLVSSTLHKFSWALSELQSYLAVS